MVFSAQWQIQSDSILDEAPEIKLLKNRPAVQKVRRLRTNNLNGLPTPTMRREFNNAGGGEEFDSGATTGQKRRQLCGGPGLFHLVVVCFCS